ncbi:MAG: SxtJ family membrane protein [Pseudomonadota bacterium]
MAASPNNSAERKTLSNRTFGLIFAFIFAVIAAFPLLWGNGIRMWAAYIAGGFTAVSLLVPVLLTPLNKLWAKFGMMMHKITNPLLMGLVFYITVLPTGIIMKLLGKDPMRRKKEPEADSYWIKREDGALKPESFDQQF